MVIKVSSFTCHGISPWLSERMNPPPGAAWLIVCFTTSTVWSGVQRRISTPFRFPRTVSFPLLDFFTIEMSSLELHPTMVVPVNARSSIIERQLPDARWMPVGPLILVMTFLAMLNPVSRNCFLGIMVGEENGSK